MKGQMLLPAPGPQTTENCVKGIVDGFRLLGLTDESLGYLAVAIHITFGLWMLGNLYAAPITAKYLLYIVVFLIVLASNYYFHGCILSRVERRLFDTKEWCGPVSLFKLLGIDVDSTLANQVVKYAVAAPAAIGMISRMVWAGWWLAAGAFALTLTPLLFVHSQDYLWHKFLHLTVPAPTELPSLSGKTIVITGASSGIGRACAVAAARAGARLILLMRPSAHAKLVATELSADVVDCDMASFDSVRGCAAKVLELLGAEGRIDILFNNAGVSNTAPALTADGFETQFQVNFLSHVLLTDLLRKPLLAAPPGVTPASPAAPPGVTPASPAAPPGVTPAARGVVINHTSFSYCIPAIPLDTELFRPRQTQFASSQHYYQQSKLALLLHSHALRASGMRSIAFQPGLCKTRLFEKSVLPGPLIAVLHALADPPEIAADSFVRLCAGRGSDGYSPSDGETSGLAGPKSIFLSNVLNVDLVNPVAAAVCLSAGRAAVLARS